MGFIPVIQDVLTIKISMNIKHLAILLLGVNSEDTVPKLQKSICLNL